LPVSIWPGYGYIHGIVMHGLILTHTYRLEDFIRAVRRAGMNAVKYVSGWGPQGGWSEDKIITAASNFRPEHIILRTVAGDPSYRVDAYGYSEFRFPEVRYVAADVAPWQAVGARFWLEIGNEPNTHIRDEAEIWVYRYHLDQSIAYARQNLPGCKIIAPALILGGDYKQARFLEICADVFRKCDAIGVHVYEHDAFVRTEQNAGTTGQVIEAIKLYAQFTPNHPIIVSEYGINDPKTSVSVKGSRYGRFAKSLPGLFRNPVLGSFAYHYCADEEVHPQYHFSRLGQEAFAEAIK
jgi:hypothetical protein